ncbi:1-acylglycerol-3-phosphate O-acyltransferase [Clydaea vesicula]|uniref:1-acyl-sn-glycerol-3-phosphate acyltransferase n=1 Tax=Clydaea vesicula TaxID=447962 RepID=A0AAD5U6M2_9FUNG|nr:1-acylglycerol-3-phosphate O-acyltransferase [Clydaea vesicula]KAJ3387366.1 1-acylglycerol-3-phosphate O-acyltransferase [Lobulomyces angularis]
MILIDETLLYFLLFLSISTVLYFTVPKFKLAVATILFTFSVLVTSIVGLFIAIPTGDSANYYVARFMSAFAGGLLNIRYQVDGKVLDEPAVYICNHQSSIDLLAIGTVFPKKCSMLAKDELKYYPILGWYMILSKAVFIKRKNRTDAIETMQNVGLKIKKDKTSLFLFPEGTRSFQKDNSLLPFKKGAFHLAVSGQIPIVPIVVSTFHNVFPDGGLIRVKVLPPIATAGLTASNIDSLIENTRNSMLTTLKEISEPVTDLSDETKKDI